MAERCAEHFSDAESFSKKSHMIKHWMVSHGEMNTLPPFRIKILKRYRDCLSRQVGEAIHILLSNDELLNSKNEYIQNCIARITVQEDLYERKARLLREEAEEKRLEMEIQTFKSTKRPAKRKPNYSLEPNKRLKLSLKAGGNMETSKEVREVVADPPEREVGLLPQVGEEDVADPPEREVGRKMAGSQKLEVLRQRMQEEKIKVLRYLENKKQL